MLIPQGQGNTRTLNLSTFHLWTGIACIAVAAFATMYFYQRAETLQVRLQAAQTQAVAVETLRTAEPGTSVAIPSAGPSADRAQYEATLEVLLTELDEVLQLEDQVRGELKMEPREKAPTGFVSQALSSDNGRGGPPASSAGLEVVQERPTRPDSLIEGVARPSADMILAELTHRRASINDLLSQVRELQRAARAEAEAKAAISMAPSRWPTRHSRARISSRYGNRPDPFTRRLRHHDGIDFSAPYGTDVLATAHGKVVKAGWNRYLGNMVEIQHQNDLTTMYGHMSKLTVSTGQTVTGGQVIGKVGSTGKSTGAHIHYEIRRNGRHINPSKYVKK
jgi:murein DD-endopeptidase MepM/ murein hydrolase activator NlpD